MSKVSFGEAATSAGVHFNTLRNWRKAGKLKTAEKVIENGRELWLVELEEVEELTRQSRQKIEENPANYHVDISGANPANTLPGMATTPTNNPGPPPALAINQAQEQTIAFMRESVVRPLVEANERQARRLEEMAEEIGTLKERVRQLEAAQASRDAARLAESPPPINITPKAENGPQAAQEPSPILNKETLQPVTPKKGFWARLFSV